MKGTFGKQATLQPPSWSSKPLAGGFRGQLCLGWAARIQSQSVGGKATLCLHPAHGGWKYDLGLISLR